MFCPNPKGNQGKFNCSKHMSKKKINKVSKGKKTTETSSAKRTAKTNTWSVSQQVVPNEKESLFKKIFWIAFGVIALVTIIMAVQTGVNEDDKFHYGYAEHLAKYYNTLGEDTAALNVKKGKMHFYGGFVDITTRTISGLFGFERTDSGYNIVRHIFLGLIGILGFLFTGLIGRRIGGWRMGALAMAILFLCPRFLGHTGINPRDIPFASGYIMSVYFMIRFFGEIPKVSWKTILGLAAGIGLALGTRSGALLLVAYFGLFGLIHMFLAYRDKRINSDKLLIKYLIPGAIAVFAGYALALLFWPYGLTKPITNVLNSIREFSNYSTVLRMLFAGDMNWSTDIGAGKYILHWFSIALPLLLMVGVILSLVFSKGIVKKYNRFYIGIVTFIFVFPIIYILSKQSNLYAGIRHLLFLFPPLAILAAFGWEYLISKFETSNKSMHLASIGAFGLLSLLPLTHIATNFKTCYVYFNSISGGVKGALGEYELDYWGVSVKSGLEYLERQGIFDDPEKAIRIGTNYPFVLQQYVHKYPNVVVPYVRFRERYEREWDYAIFVNHFIDGAHLRSGKYIDNNVIKVLGKGDTPFSMIFDNTGDRKASNGWVALKANNVQEAQRLFQEEVAENPNNENAFYGLGQAYFNQQQYAQADKSFDNLLLLNPESQMGLTYGGLTALNLGKLDKALDYFIKGQKLNPRDANALYYQGVIYSRKGDSRQAIDKLKAALQINPAMKQTYQLLIQEFQKLGDQQQANYFQQLMGRYVK